MRFANRVRIGCRELGPERPVFVIAEAGVNHNGSLDQAKRLIDAAAEAGADAVKFQTFSASRLATASAPTAAYQKSAPGSDATQLALLARLEINPSDHGELADYCRQKGIIFLSTPFDDASLDLLLDLDVPAIKIGSGDLTDLQLIRRAAASGKPLLLSTGMATLQEVADALAAIEGEGNRQLVLMHCVSSYPAAVDDANLRALRPLADLGTLVGYSDHTPGIEVSLAAAALGAVVIEKHLTLDRNAPGPDHKASLAPTEFTAMVQGIRCVTAALGDGVKLPRPSEEPLRQVVRKSLVTARSLPAGTVLEPDMLTRKRPGDGIPPGELEAVVGRTIRRDLPADAVLKWHDLLPSSRGRDRSG